MPTCVAVVLVAIALGFPAASTAEAPYVLKHDVVGNGAMRSGDPFLGIRGTVGQTAIGRSTNFFVIAKKGFWYTLRTDTLATTGVGDGPSPTPVAHLLAQNHPNPFAQTTRISFELPAREHVTLQVVDVSGRQVALLVDETLDLGKYVVDLHAGNWASGLYFYRIKTPTFSAVRKLLFLR